MEFNAERGASNGATSGVGSDSKTGGKVDDPSLADMTRAALSILSRNDKGFFLFLEGN